MENKESQNIEQKTVKLKELIKLADSSGQSAWQSGKILYPIKTSEEYKKLKNYGSFKRYVEGEFGINDTTANVYIKISNTFSESDVQKLASSNLKVISEIENTSLRKQVIEAFSSEDPKNYKVKDVIATIASLPENCDYTQNEIKGIIKNTVTDRIKDERTKRKRNRDVKIGKPLKSVAMPHLPSIIEKEPINEMGVVALFCILFQNLTNAPFNRNGEIYFFKTIQYVQTAFPDARILCRVRDKKEADVYLDVEFEYYSYEYINHEHHKSPKHKDCAMIICWEDNTTNHETRSASAIAQELPPILELKDLLETGEINLKQVPKPPL